VLLDGGNQVSDIENILDDELRTQIDDLYAAYLRNKKENFHYFNNGVKNLCLECKPGYQVELKDMD
jgi:hypothetical protein